MSAHTAEEAAPRGAASSLPRLGSDAAGTADVPTTTVDIPERGVSVVLKKPSVEAIIEIQGRTKDDASVQESFDETVALIARMLVDPVLEEEQLAAEVKNWSMTDWLVLQEAAMGFSGLSEEEQRAAQSEFRGEDD